MVLQSHNRIRGWTIFFYFFFMTSFVWQNSHALHLAGTWNSDDDFFLFLTKFGFKKSELLEKNDTHGFIFGNLTDPHAPKETTDWVTHLDETRPQIDRSSTTTTTTTQLPKKLTTTKQTIINSSSSSTSKSVVDNPNNVKSSTTPQPTFLSSITNKSSSIVTTNKPKSNVTSLVSMRRRKRDSHINTTSTVKEDVNKRFYPATLVVLDRGYFLDFYRNRLIPDRNEACAKMFESVSIKAYDPYCNPNGTTQYIRRIPCPVGGICIDHRENSKASVVVQDHQFTYAISDPDQAKFWYVSLVACYRDPVTCKWKHSNSSKIDYDIWLVNGNPYTKNQNPLEYQFSFDRQDTVEIYLLFFVCYLLLVPLQVHAVLRQRHIVPRLFTSSVGLELTAVLSNVIHNLTFCLDGEGHPYLAVFGDITDILARAIFMLILLLLAKGWAITRTELTGKPFIFTIWSIYGIVHILLYVWNRTEVDVIEDIDEYETWPGWLILILRTVIMIWFLYELRDTMDHEHQPHKLNFFLHFGAAALVWFIYLPIIALIALQISPLWRSKLLLGITYSADCLAFAVMTHLLWPTRSQQYFLLASNLDTSINDELEEFNEAPHNVNPYSSSTNNNRRVNNLRYPINYSFHDVSSSEAVSLTFNSHPHSNHSIVSNGNGTYPGNSDDKDTAPLIVT